MSAHSTYEALRHFADSWALLAMTLMFIACVIWPFRRRNRERNEAAATMILRDDDDGE
jgi:cytochrome c oxidase cbb3-type subunit 4